ncbi:MAG: DUF87 domain-containing protein [Clostridia bacterium]|nr:DUF87 domain-containing protein [Clostridia bacterium]
MTLLLFCAIVLLSLFTGRTVFAGFGGAICTFMYGTFGYGCYFVVALLAYLGEWLAFEKKIKLKVRPVIWCALTLLCLFLLFHTVTTRDFDFDSTYIGACYIAAEEGWSGYTFGGVISALIVYPVVKLMTAIGAYIIFSLLTVLFAYFLVMSVRKYYFKKVDTVGILPESEKAENNEAQNLPAAEQTLAEVAPAYSAPEQGYSQPEYSNPQQPYYDNQQYDNRQYAQPTYDNQQYNNQLYDMPVDQAYNRQTEYVSPMQQVFGRQEEPQPQEEEIDYKSLGRKILFENGEFDAENYRRNGIFDENSYFNHPIRNEGDYLKGFSSDKKTSGTNIQQTYSSAYKESVEQQKTETPNSVYYGDEPTDKLEDFTPASTGAYTSEPEQSVLSDAAEDKPNPYELFPYETEDRDVQDDQPFNPETYEEDGLDNSDSNLFDNGVNNENTYSEESPSVSDIFSSRGRGGTDRNENNGQNIFPADFSENERHENSAELSENRRQAGFGERSRDSLNLSRSEENQETENSNINNLYNLFGNGNSRLGESRAQDDGITPRGRERGTSDLFDSQEESTRGRDSGLFDRSEERASRSNANLFDEEPEEDKQSDSIQETSFERPSVTEEQPARAIPATPVTRRMPDVKEVKEEKKEEAAPPPPHVWKKYVRPSLDLLDDYPEYGNVNTAEVEDSKRIIVETLNSFRIECEVSDVVIGPAITRYDIIIHDKTNIKNSLRYRESIAMALKKDNVNAYLNYAKGALSIEVPNTKRTTIGLKTMMTSSAFINCKSTSLTFALGKNVDGVPVCPDITKMPHLLVAGTTGSGKSICLSSLLISLLYKYGPEELRLILVDPKQVEFISYDKLPHLMINEIIYDVDKAIKALNWAIKEMERRYSLFKGMTESGTNAKGGIKVATKNLDEYNSHLEEGAEKLPKIVIILDEFGDLMLQAKKDIESRIIKLVQKARACGIHLILATQRPSVDCITGLIKSNLPTRIGFKVGSFDDSRTIFDVGGAEKLLGAGDMYFRSAERPELARIQGCFVDSHEVQKVTDFIKANNETYFDQSVSDFINKVEEPEASSSLSESGGFEAEETKIDDVFLRALKYCVDSNKASVSMLQRRFPIGYMKACKIIDWMENMNYITKGEGPNSRKVLLSRDEFINTYGDIDD